MTGTPLPTFNPLDYGASGIGTGDALPAFQAALAAIPAYGGDLVVPPNPSGGPWNFLSNGGRLLIAQSNVRVLGAGRASWINGGISAIPDPSTWAPGTTMRAPPGYCDVAWLAASIAGAAVGGYVFVQGAMPAPATGWVTLCSRVEAIDPTDGAVVVSHPFPINCAAAPAFAIQFFPALEGIEISGLRLTGAGLGSSACFDAIDGNWLAKSKITDIWAEGFNGAGLALDVGLDMKVERIEVEKCGGVLSGASQIAAISLAGQTGLSASELHALNSAGIGIEIGSCSHSALDDISSVHASVLAPGGYWSGRGIKFRSMQHCTVTNFRSMNNGSTGVALCQGSQNNTLVNGVICRNENFSATTPDGNGLWLDGTGNSVNRGSQLIIHSNQIYDIAINAGDNYNEFSAISWDGKLANSGIENVVTP